MSTIIPFHRPKRIDHIGPLVGVIAGSQVFNGTTGPILEIRFVAALNSIAPEQRQLLPRMLESGNFTVLTLEQER
ncbi:MAG: hypothetical protein RKO66_05400 [Candidatus Contendobacter sp.]|nr:hypothetical protein [Candidatus Contendobacter sp.]MDS4058229.1 hypothetical protein [Candidatus Contendobacter sp.]